MGKLQFYKMRHLKVCTPHKSVSQHSSTLEVSSDSGPILCRLPAEKRDFQHSIGRRHEILHFRLCLLIKRCPLVWCPLTALIILPRTPKICPECLRCFNLSQTRSSHHRNHRQRTISYLSRNKLFSLGFSIQLLFACKQLLFLPICLQCVL